jgi:hypothetical protein
MATVKIYAEGDDQVLEGQLADVIQALREFPSCTEHMMGVMVGVALAGMVSGMRDFHFVQIADNVLGDPNTKLVKISLSTIDGVGWGLSLLEDQQPRVIQ